MIYLGLNSNSGMCDSLRGLFVEAEVVLEAVIRYQVGQPLVPSDGSGGLSLLILVLQGGIHWYLFWQLPVGLFLNLQVACLDAVSSSDKLGG